MVTSSYIDGQVPVMF